MWDIYYIIIVLCMYTFIHSDHDTVAFIPSSVHECASPSLTQEVSFGCSKGNDHVMYQLSV